MTENETTSGPVSEAAKTARAAINGLSSSPVILALVVMQILMFGGVAYVTVQRQKDINEQFKMVFERCLPSVQRP